MKPLFTLLIAFVLSSYILYASPEMPSVAEYNRKDWKHWIDADKDGQDTRQEVLIQESLIPVVFNSKGKVDSGKWYDPYTNQYFTNPKDLDIDHLVPLKKAHDAGGANWSKSQKMDFANNLEDENHLIAVHKSANRSKGAKGPAEWLPPNAEYRCEYITNWIGVKIKYNLKISGPTYDTLNQHCVE